MKECPSPVTLVDFVDGRLRPEDEAEVRQHLLLCLGCRAAVAGRATAGSGGPARDKDRLPSGELAAIGEHIGPYRVTRQIGEGGMGAVFEAIHERIQRVVAIKVLFPEHIRTGQGVTRLFNEARAVNIVGHPGLVSVFDVGVMKSGAPYLVMELLAGESLSARLRKGPMGLSALPLFRQMAAALTAAHAKGIIHRDLKPGNVMIVPDRETGGERAKVLDFGIAKLSQEHHIDGDVGLTTRSGVIMGTPVYMSPEQVRAGEVQDRTDVYSLGIMLYECLTGAPPFQRAGAMAVMSMHLYNEVPALDDARLGLPSALPELLRRMLAKDPAQRPAMKDVSAAFAQMERGDLRAQEGDAAPVTRAAASLAVAQVAPPPAVRPSSRFLGAVGLAIALLIGIVLTRSFWRGGTGSPPRQVAGLARPVPAPDPGPSRAAPPTLPASAAPALSPRPVQAPARPTRHARESSASKDVATPPAAPSSPVQIKTPDAPVEWTDGKIKIFK